MRTIQAFPLFTQGGWSVPLKMGVSLRSLRRDTCFPAEQMSVQGGMLGVDINSESQDLGFCRQGKKESLGIRIRLYGLGKRALKGKGETEKKRPMGWWFGCF